MAILDRSRLYAETEVKLVRGLFETIKYFGEMVVGPLLAIFLFETSTLSLGNAAILASAGMVSWTLAEYLFHRFVLHRLVPAQHRIHHAHPDQAVLSIFWQIWVCFAVAYFIAGGAFLAGSLVAYAWYLFVHHCTHHNTDRLPAFLIRNHEAHHQFATRNYGVTTTLWDNVFGTALQ
jgi:sterol desaturase/sphingolipid hydroxylase (fatty acid hydroxylase superfamily)